MRFSVIIPYAQNRGTFRACLESVRTAADALAAVDAAEGVEILCVNGGSDDGTDALVAEAAVRDPRLVPILGWPAETGPGAGPARNRGLAAATGDYLVFVDADDTLDPDALVRLKDATADIVTFLPPAGTFDLTRPEDRRKTFSPLVGNLLVWNAAYRREAVAGLAFPNLVNHEDLVWTCAAYARAKTVTGGMTPWYRYDAHVAGSAVNSHSARRVRAAWAATAMMWKAVRPAFAAAPLALRLVMARKMTMHLILHCLKEVFLAARAKRKRPPMRERWLVDARTFGSRPTGVGLYACRHVRRLLSEGRDLVLVTDVQESAAMRGLAAQGVPIRAYGRRVSNSVGVLGYFRFVQKVVAETRPSVFWQPNNIQPFKPKGVPRVIVTMHDTFGLGSFSGRTGLSSALRLLPWRAYYRFSFGRTIRNATELEYNSQQTKREVEALSERARQLDGPVVYPIAEVTPATDAAIATCRARHGRYFLYLGNVETRKGADVLLAAYRLYRAMGGTAALVFAGLERDVHPPRGDGIEALGYVPDDEKFALMGAALALVVPSRAEGYGMQVAEAAALGITCLASDLPVFGEIDPSGRVTFPAGDAAALAGLLLGVSR